MSDVASKAQQDEAAAATRVRAGRPTKAAAAERDERLLEIATTMFLEQGFDATSMDGLAEAAAIGKATLYARYADKGALFADVLRRRIVQIYGTLEEELLRGAEGASLETALQLVARRLLEKSLMPGAIALGRILSAQGPRFPELAQLAVREGWGRQLRLVEKVLARYADTHAFLLDTSTAADLFISLVVGRTARLATLGMTIEPEAIAARTEAATSLFVRGLVGPEALNRPDADRQATDQEAGKA